MDAISNTDRFVALLRKRLAERAAAKGASRTDRTPEQGRINSRPTASAPLSALAAQAGADDNQLRRTILEQVLTERLGGELTNSPKFQQIVEKTLHMMMDDPQLSEILSKLANEYKATSS